MVISKKFISIFPQQDINRFLFWMATVIGLHLKIQFMSRDFWHDEAFQVLFSAKPLNFILDSNDVHPPLFTLITKIMIWFTTDPIVLRTTIVIMSIMFGFLFYMTIREWFGESVAVASYLLLNLSSTFAFYSTEFRSYMFVMILTILQMRYFHKIISGSEEYKHHLRYIVMSALMLYSHYMAGLVILAQVCYLYILYIRNRNRLSKEIMSDYRDFFFSHLKIFILFCFPLFIYLIKTLPKIQSFWFKDIGLISYISTYMYLIALPDYPIFYIEVIFVAIMIALALVYLKDRFDEEHLLLALYVIVPITSMWIFSQVFPFYHHRYFMFGGMMIFVMAGFIFAEFNKNKSDINIVLIGTMLVLLFFYPITYQTPLHDSAQAIPDDDAVVIHESTFSQTPFKVYLPTHRHLLMTGLTKKQMFTAGGSVVDDSEVIPLSGTAFKMPDNQTFYLVTEQSKKILWGEKVYDKDGIKITKFQG